MKKLILMFAIMTGFSAMAQNANKKVVLDIETGDRYLTNKISPIQDGGVHAELNPAEIVRGNVQGTPARIKVYNGPSFKTEIPGGGATKICYNTNRWPCMIVWDAISPGGGE